MPVNSTVLFGEPHTAIASLITDRIKESITTSIVAGFATTGGLAAIDAPLRANPLRLKTLVLGAATYAGFQALDDLVAAGIPQGRLRIHLGHTALTGGKRNPFARYHPMLHSKVYYMELPGAQACAFVGSHNLTAFALGGLNGEAAVMLEGPADGTEFEKVRRHIASAEGEAIPYSPAVREAFAWWSKQYFDGVEAEIGFPQDWTIIRTILIFATVSGSSRPKLGEQIYFELPSGIHIDNVTTEVHLFLFDTLPASPLEALSCLSSAAAKFTGVTLGADNEQGNAEVRVNWQIERTPKPTLRPVLTGRHRPSTPRDMQQVRAKVTERGVEKLEYGFERERGGWDPVFSPEAGMRPPQEFKNEVALTEARGGRRPDGEWRLVTGLNPRTGASVESDQAALSRARPDSGSFILVSLRRRKAGGQAD